MKNMKRFIMLLFILVTVFSFFSCSNNSQVEDSVVLFELKNETLILSTPVSDCSACVFIDGEKKGSSFLVEDKKIGLPKFIFNSSAGKVVSVKLEFVDDDGKVFSEKEYTVDVVHFAIDNAEEFSAWYSAYKTHYDKREYVILTNDITLSGGVLDNERMSAWLTNMYNGTFDGRGHVIYDFSSIYGFMPNMGKGSCIKNLALVNMTTTGTGGFLGKHICGGTIENCYFQGRQTNVTGGNLFTGFYSRYYDDIGNNGYVERVENVVIDVKRTSAGAVNDAFADTAFSMIPKDSSFVNVIMVNDSYNGRAFFNQLVDNMDITMFNSSSSMKGEITSLPLGFSSDLWCINSRYGLTFKSVNA